LEGARVGLQVGAVVKTKKRLVRHQAFHSGRAVPRNYSDEHDSCIANPVKRKVKGGNPNEGKGEEKVRQKIKGLAVEDRPHRNPPVVIGSKVG